MKRYFSVLLTLVILLESSITCSVHAASAQPVYTPNKNLLDAMLYGDRKWVIETLVNDSRKNNPQAVIQHTSAYSSLSKEALNVYNGIDAKSQTNAAIYKGMVCVMEKLYNSEEYMSGLVDSVGDLVSWAAGLFTGKDDLKDSVDSLTASTDEMRYDRLLKAVLTENYTASDGTSVGASENSLIYVRQVKDALNYLNAFINYADSGLNSIRGTEQMPAFTSQYINQYAIPYRDAAENYLQSLNAIAGNNQSADSIGLAASIAALSYYGAIMPENEYSGFSYQDYLREYIVDNDIEKIFSAAGKTLKVSQTALDSYLYINSLNREKNVIIGPVKRIKNSTSDKDMKSSLANVEKLMSDSYDSSILSCDSIAQYLRSQGTVNNLVSKGTKSAVKKLFP